MCNMMWPSVAKVCAEGSGDIVFIQKFIDPKIGVNKKWISNWANIGPKWPNVKYNVAFCCLLWQKYARKAYSIGLKFYDFYKLFVRFLGVILTEEPVFLLSSLGAFLIDD